MEILARGGAKSTSAELACVALGARRAWLDFRHLHATVRVVFHWLAGHEGVEGNERAAMERVAEALEGRRFDMVAALDVIEHVDADAEAVSASAGIDAGSTPSLAAMAALRYASARPLRRPA